MGAGRSLLIDNTVFRVTTEKKMSIIILLTFIIKFKERLDVISLGVNDFSLKYLHVKPFHVLRDAA